MDREATGEELGHPELTEEVVGHEPVDLFVGVEEPGRGGGDVGPTAPVAVLVPAAVEVLRVYSSLPLFTNITRSSSRSTSMT